MRKKGTVLAALLLALTSVLSITPIAGEKDVKRKASSEPILLVMEADGRFSKGYSWHLKVGSHGQAQLSIQTYPKPKQRQFKVSAAQFAALRKALATERFFELDKEYGGRVPDGSTRSITVVQGKRTKTVAFHFLREDDLKLADIQRALRVWHLARGWFNDTDAVDLRPYDRRILKAAQKKGS